MVNNSIVSATFSFVPFVSLPLFCTSLFRLCTVCMCKHFLHPFSFTSFFFLFFLPFHFATVLSHFRIQYCQPNLLLLILLSTFFVLPIPFHFSIDNLVSCASLPILCLRYVSFTIPKIGLQGLQGLHVPPVKCVVLC